MKTMLSTIVGEYFLRRVVKAVFLLSLIQAGASKETESWDFAKRSFPSSQISDSIMFGLSGTCTSDKECTATIRSRSPPKIRSGVGLCDCYAASSTFPFDECEGEGAKSAKHCRSAKCTDSCDKLEARCLLSPGSNDGTKMCALREIKPSPTTSASGSCTSDNECIAKVRSGSPGQSSSGVGLCDCYAASSSFPFDECEGAKPCMIAGCSENSCDKLEARCLFSPDTNDGMCALREIKPSPTTSAPGTCTSDNECTATIRSGSPDQNRSGVEVCDCYAASSSFPFDECEGAEFCMSAMCIENSCARLNAHCLLSPGSNDGMCALRKSTSSLRSE